eukprot:g9829.t1
MKFKLNCQWEVEDSIVKSMILQHEDEISSETDELLEKELATEKNIAYIKQEEELRGISVLAIKLNGIQDAFYGSTILHVAAEGGHPDLVEYLIYFGADPNSNVDIYGNTPLHRAAFNGNIDAAKRIVTLGGNVLLQNKRKCTPKSFAKGYPANVEVVQFLDEVEQYCSAQEKIDDVHHNAAFICAKYGIHNSLAFLVDRFHINLREHDSFDLSPIHYAAIGNYRTTILSILSHDISCQHARTPLSIGKGGGIKSANSGNQLAIEMSGVEEETIFAIQYPFHYAARTGAIDILQQMIFANGPKQLINTPDCLPITQLQEDEKVEEVGDTEGVGSHYISPYGQKMVPLAHAISVGSIKSASFLIKHGANLDVLDGRNRTLLHHAALNGREKVVPWLLQEMSNNNLHSNVSEFLSAQDQDGKTALHYASELICVVIVRALVSSFDDNIKLEEFKQVKDKSNLTAFDSVSTYTDEKLKELNASKSKYNMMLGLIDC